MTPTETFAANLKRERKKANLSQEELAQACGLHPTAISRLERAVRDPRLSTVATVASGLGVPASQLVRGL